MSLNSIKEKFLSFINTENKVEENPFMEEENRKTDEHSPLLQNLDEDIAPKETEEEPTLKQKFLDFSRTVIVKKKSLKKRVKYYVPAIGWLPKYEYKKNLVLDIISGITIGVLLVPVALSYAVLIGLPPIYGLQASFYPLIIYFLFGTSRQMSIGPEAIVSILTATALDLFEDQSDRTGLAMAITFFTGLFTFALGLFRFGFLAQILSRPLLCGFINAVALEIMFEQSDKFFGLEFPEVHSFKKFWSIFEHWIDVSYPTLILGLACVAALLLFRLCKSKIKRAQKYLVYVPDSFILVVVGILLAKFLNLPKEGVAILGENKAGFLAPRWPRLNMSELPSVASSSLVIAIIGVVESILCAQTYADKHKYRVSPNRELVAVGLVNFIGSFFQIFPAFGSLARTSINDSAGAKSQTGALFSVLVVLSAILFFLPYFAYLPKVVMGAIIVNAAIGLLEIHDVIFLWKLRAKVELCLFAVTFLSTLILGVETGIITSIIISVFLIIKQTSMPHIAILKQVPETKKFEELVTITDINLFEDKHTWFTLNAIPGVDASGVLTLRIDASLYFANIGQLKELFQKLEQRSKVKLSGVIIDASSIPNIDASALQILIEIIEEWKSRGIKVCFLKLRPETKAMFFKAGIITLVGSENFFCKAI